MKNNISDYYRIIFDPNDPKKWCVALQKPCAPFHEIIYSYGEFGVQSTGENDPNSKFKYQIDIIYVPDRLKGITFPDDKQIEMENLIFGILFDILEKNSDKTKSLDGKLYLELSRETNER
jgi:hypothetical protein